MTNVTMAMGARGAGLVTAVVLLAGCGDVDVPVVDDVPVAQAEPVDFVDSPLSDPTDPTDPTDTTDPTDPGDDDPTDDPDDDGAPSPSPTSEIGPSSAAAAAFVRGEALTDLRDVEHVVVDLDGDTWPEVVATGIRARAGVVRVAWWTVDGYEVMAEGSAGPGTDVRDLRATDLNGDGRIELLVRVEGDGLASLALWQVLRRGVVEPLVAVGGCHGGTHVYGVTRARLEDAGGGPPTIVADCDDSPLPVADWSEQRWTWQDGAYRVDPSSLPVATDDPLTDDDVDPGDDAVADPDDDPDDVPDGGGASPAGG